MPSGSVNKQFIFPGYAFGTAAAAVTFDATAVYEVSLPAGKLVTSWVKTDADTAAANLPAGHGYATGKFDVYFAAGMRYGVDGTVTGDAIALDGGTGTDFPATAAADVVVTRQVEIATAIDGDNVKLFGVFFRSTDTDAVGHVDFQDVGDASIEALDLAEVDNAATGMDHAYGTTAAVALLTGNPITHAAASNGSSTAAATIFILCGIDATP